MVKQKLIGRGLLTVVILVLMATIVYDQIKLHRKLVEYHVYSAGGYFLELKGGDPSVDNLIIDGRISGVRLFDIAMGEPFYRSDLNLIDNGGIRWYSPH